MVGFGRKGTKKSKVFYNWILKKSNQKIMITMLYGWFWSERD